MARSIKGDDPKGIRVYCDANQPTFTPLDYTPENLIYQKPAKFAGYKSDNTNKNDWLVVNQLAISGPKHNRRPDIVIYINTVEYI